MPEENTKPIKFVEVCDYLVRDGCKPIPVPLVRKICLNLISKERTQVFYCVNCKVLHEHKQCPECGDNSVMSKGKMADKITVEEWPKY